MAEVEDKKWRVSLCCEKNFGKGGEMGDGGGGIASSEDSSLSLGGALPPAM